MLSRMVGTVVFRNSRLTANSSLLLTVVMMFMFSAAGLAQSTAGRILGTLIDQSGAAVAGASVSVSDVQRGTSRTTTTDSASAAAAAKAACR